LDTKARTLKRDGGEDVPLTNGEYELLLAFVQAPHKVQSRDELLNATHGRDAGPYDKTIDVQVVRLRRKIERDATQPDLIKAVHGSHRGHFMAHASSRAMGSGMNLVGLRRDGVEFPIEVGLAPLDDGHGGSLAAAFVRDLSPTHRGQAAFRQARYQEVVRRFSQEAFTEMDLERVVQRAPEMLVAALECDASELFMLSKDRREFR